MSAPVRPWRRTHSGVKVPARRNVHPPENRRLRRRGNTGWGAAGGEQPVRTNVTNNVNPIRLHRLASLRALLRSPGQDLHGQNSLCGRTATGSAGWQTRAEIKRERTERPGLGRWRGWEQKGWTWVRDKQGDPPGSERGSWPHGPKNRPAGVRASVGALKRGNARGAKGRRKVDVE
jgi:hypothetical protein